MQQLTSHRPDGAAPRPPAEHGFRPDIQGVRAIAIALVVVFHLYPALLPGGFVGVDVFFVVSGYLITGHLARLARRGRRVRLLEFYGRRARRLLPAAALVLTVTAVASRLWLPATLRHAADEQIRAAALYFQNWRLAADAVDYFARTQPASPVEHFWSLSVEEQFYLVWPLLFLAAAAAGLAAARSRRRRGAGSPDEQARRTVRGTLLALTATTVIVFFAVSVLVSAREPTAAYFVTPTRMWELGIGGLAALLPRRAVAGLERRGVIAWAGLAAIVASAVILSGRTAFPGWIALVPVLGAVAMILCGSPDARHGTAPWTGAAAAVFLGDISYELYLWHWPMIIVWGALRGDAASGHGMGPASGPAIAAAAVLAAWLTKKYVTDPVRHAPAIMRSPGRSLATAVCVAVPAVLATGLLAAEPGPWHGSLGPDHPGARAAVQTLQGGAARPSAPASARLLPPPTQAQKNLSLFNKPDCQVGPSDPTPTLCVGNDPAHPKLTVAAVGDSHIGMWSTSLAAIAKKHDWRLVGEVHSSCRWTATMTLTSTGAPYTACHAWGQRVLHELIHTIKPDVVVFSTSDRSGTPRHPDAGAASSAQIGDGMATYFRDLLAHGIRVVAIRETPRPDRDVPTCLAEHDESVSACATPAATALPGRSAVDAAHALLGARLPVVDMNDILCPHDTCPPALGGVIVYRNAGHLTQAITRTLTPYLSGRLLATGAFGAR